MKMVRRLLTVLTLSLLPAAAAAQDYPAKPIKLIVPFPAGGPNDIVARIVGQRMSELTRQPVIIDNRGGQGGALGTDAGIVRALAIGHRHQLSDRRADVMAGHPEPVDPAAIVHVGERAYPLQEGLLPRRSVSKRPSLTPYFSAHLSPDPRQGQGTHTPKLIVASSQDARCPARRRLPSRLRRRRPGA